MLESNWINFYFSFELKVFYFFSFFSLYSVLLSLHVSERISLGWGEHSLATPNLKCEQVIHIHIDVVWKLQISSFAMVFPTLGKAYFPVLVSATWQSAYVYILVFSINFIENEVKSIYSDDTWKCKRFYAFTAPPHPFALSFWIDGYR